MTGRPKGSIRNDLLICSLLVVAWPALAADVTPERLLNPDKEPQNWLMNHRTYDGQRYSPLARISRDNVKNLKLAYAVPLGGVYPRACESVIFPRSPLCAGRPATLGPYAPFPWNFFVYW